MRTKDKTKTLMKKETTMVVGDIVRAAGFFTGHGEVIEILPQQMTIPAEPPYDYSDRDLVYRLLRVRTTAGEEFSIAEDRVKLLVLCPTCKVYHVPSHAAHLD